MGSGHCRRLTRATWLLRTVRFSRLAARRDKVVVTDTFAPWGRQPTYLPTGGRQSRRPELTYLPTPQIYYLGELVTSKKDQTQLAHAFAEGFWTPSESFNSTGGSP